MRRLLVLVIAAGLVACGDDEGPNAADIAGTWSGTWTTTDAPSTVAVLELEQDGTEVTGSLALTTGRTATITNGQVDENTFSFSLEDDDTECPGTIEMTGDVQEDATRLSGTYISTDCEGSTEGSFTLTH